MKENSIALSRHPLSVVQLVPSLESGGVERGTLEVAGALVRQGHRSIVISAGGRLVESLQREGSEHITWPIGRKSLRTAGYIVRLRRWLRSQHVDIVHARSRVPAWIAWLAWKSLPEAERPRFVTTMHGLNSVNRFSRIMTRGETVIAVSHAVRQYVLDHYPDVPTERLQVIHRGIDPQAFPYGFTPSADWQDRWLEDHPQFRGTRLITLAGRITRLKGHHDFLVLLKRLKDAGEKVHGAIVGDEDPRRRQYAAELRARISSLRLENDVTFVGHRPDIREVFAASDLVLSLSTKPESFGRTTLEPLALGVPVVGYDHGGVGEILQTVFPFGAVPCGDADALFERVRRLLSDRATRVAPFATFRLQTMLDETLKLYSRLADKPRHDVRRAA